MFRLALRGELLKTEIQHDGIAFWRVPARSECSACSFMCCFLDVVLWKNQSLLFLELFLALASASLPLLITSLQFPSCLFRLESDIHWTFLCSRFFVLLTQLASFPQYHCILFTLCVHLFRPRAPSGRTRSLMLVLSFSSPLSYSCGLMCSINIIAAWALMHDLKIINTPFAEG